LQSRSASGRSGSRCRYGAQALHDEGRVRAERWLAENFRSLGERSSFRLEELLSL
jgi:hypothetical protein